ncbi:MAG: STAS domain-containing protein [Deltaproteobacteria bacterium]
MSLNIKIEEREPTVFVVMPAGEVNTDTYAELESQVNALIPKAQAVIFELKEMTYISSMGLSVLFRVKSKLAEKGAKFLWVNPQPQVQKVFDCMKVLPDAMVASLEEADEYLDTFLDGVQKGTIDPKTPQ